MWLMLTLRSWRPRASRSFLLQATQAQALHCAHSNPRSHPKPHNHHETLGIRAPRVNAGYTPRADCSLADVDRDVELQGSGHLRALPNEVRPRLV
eukprot:1870817-Amphidinium_carterae.6